MNLDYLLIIIWLHFFADFLFQYDRMAIEKGHNWKYLFFHGEIYTATFLLFNPIYAVVNGILHIVVDFATSKLITYFSTNNQRHWFFVTIGMDQAIHFTCLIMSFFILNIIYPNIQWLFFLKYFG